MTEQKIIKHWKNLDKGVFLVNVLGVIFNKKTKKILIGKRKENPYIKGLTWCFPGGRPTYSMELEDSLKKEIKKKTGLKIKNLGTIFANTYPEKKEFLAIYYLCEVIGGVESPGESFIELKWVSPEEINKYFTTSFHPKLKEYLIGLK